MNSFNEFGLAEPITRALAQENYITPTPIQKDAIPLVVSGRDLIGIAQTGTGKTAAFALPILNRLASNAQPLDKKSCRVLILAPTRELAGQIAESFRTYGRFMRLSVTLAIGGVPMGKQVRAMMNGVDVLVATPGRLLDLVRSNAVRLGKVDVLVLDEADRMLDMGFIHDIRTIVGKVPAARQTLLFSATMPREIAELADTMLRDPARVAVTPVAKTADKVAQRVIHTRKADKPDLLVSTLKTETLDRALVFTRTKHGADKVVRFLDKAGIAADSLHGNKSQGQRERALANFRDGRSKILVATDIAARGIDVSGISHVINYDIPNEPESYVHRIGRTARAGAEGIAISFCDGEEAAYLRGIEKLIKMTIPATGEPPAHHAPAPRQNRGGHRQRQHNGGGERHRGGESRGNGDRPRSGDGHRGGDSRRNGENQGNRQPRNGEAPRNNEAPRYGEGAPTGERRERPHSGNRPHHSAAQGERSKGERAPGNPHNNDRNGRPHRGQRQQNGNRPENKGGHPAAAHGTVAPGGEIGSIAFMKRQDRPRRDRPDGARPVNA